MASKVINDDNKDDRTLYIGNLSEDVTPDLLLELFLEAGPVDRVSVPFCKETNKIKGFGFIEYRHLASIDYALNIFAGTKLFGRDLNMKYRNASRNNPMSQQQQQYSIMQTTLPQSLLGTLNPLAFAIEGLGDIRNQQQSQVSLQNFQQRNVNMPMNSSLASSSFRLNDYPSARDDNSRDRNYVDRRRYQDREDNRTRANPYRRKSRSRSRSPRRDDYDRRRRHGRDRGDQRDRSSGGGNYHRWNNK